MTKNKRTTSAEKAVVSVFIVTLPLGIALGFALDNPDMPTPEKEIIVRTVDVGDYDFDDEGGTIEVVRPSCREAQEAQQKLVDSLDGYGKSVAVLEPILDDMYEIAMQDQPDIGDLNMLRERVDKHQRADWSRLALQTMTVDQMEETMKACTD